MRQAVAREWAIFLLALQFLTRLPLPADVGYAPDRIAASPRWYPGVGWIVGAWAGAVFWLAAGIFPPVLAALISTAAGMVLTGALHEDGFADTCDALGGHAGRERALEIMRDSRLGTYGAAGLGVMVAAKVLALGALPGAAAPVVLVAAHGASRASAVLVMATSVYVRPAGAGSATAVGLGAAGLGLALVTGGAGLMALVLVLPGVAVAGAVLGLVVAHAGTRAWFERRLGGYTGDCLGAVQQTGEIGVYLGVLACL